MRKYSEGFKEELAVWGLVADGVCTPEQLRTTFSLEDVVKALAMKDINNAIEEKLSGN